VLGNPKNKTNKQPSFIDRCPSEPINNPYIYYYKYPDVLTTKELQGGHKL
jgi:hypothetical protein